MTSFSLSTSALLSPVGAGLDILASAVGKGLGEGDALFLRRAGHYLLGELTVLAFRGPERLSELFVFSIDIITAVDIILSAAASAMHTGYYHRYRSNVECVYYAKGRESP